jgi:hypothetical protein
MRGLALGITNTNLEQVPVGQIKIDVSAVQPPVVKEPDQPTVIPPPDDQPPIRVSAIDQAASNIRSGSSSQAQTFFIESMRKAIDYTVKNLNSESRLLLANLLSGAKLTTSSETEKVYSTKAYFSLNGQEITLNFHVKKQSDGTWLIANL